MAEPLAKHQGRIQAIIHDDTAPALFASLMGSRVYGLGSAGSDIDVHGIYVLPLTEVVGLPWSHGAHSRDVVTSGTQDSPKVEYSGHDIAKFCDLLLRKNAGILETILSPMPLFTTPQSDALRALAQSSFTSNHGNHYLRMARNQWERSTVTGTLNPKMLVYLFRAYLTGMYLMDTGTLHYDMEDVLYHYASATGLQFGVVQTLIEAKREGRSDVTFTPSELARSEDVHLRLRRLLQEKMAASQLPENIPHEVVHEVNRLLIATRIGGVG